MYSTPLERLIEQFERAWQSPRPPKIKAFAFKECAGCDPTPRRELLLELIHVDLEFRWRRTKRRGPLLEWYLKQLPELGSLDDLPKALMCQEYRVRQRWGDVPSHAEYVARFPRGGLGLMESLASVDVELAEEGVEAPARKSQAAGKRRTLPIFDPDAPLRYSDYKLKRQIGSGGMCRVYTAVQVSLDRPVAVKVLRKERLADPLAVQRFRREARLAAALSHPGIVGVHGLGRLPRGGYFMVFHLVSGTDLARLGPVSPERAQDIVAQLAEILDFVHRSEFVHCDVKPANVLLDSNDRVFLSDFGLARVVGGSEDSIFSTGPAGTPAYISPEQIHPSFGQIGPWTDIYGLGGVLYQLLYGHSPFTGTAEQILSHVTSRPRSEIPFPLLPEGYENLITVCRRCLEQSPTDRFKKAEELRERLYDVQERI